jgi:hypothetical protein
LNTIGLSWEESDDRAVMSGPGLRLVFARTGDRWTHRLELSGDSATGVACALESDPERDKAERVKSPLYQELHRHERASGPGLCVLLTGRLFQHHFSASVSMRLDDDRTSSLVLDFDVADRCRTPVEILAASYVMLFDSSALDDAGRDRIAWTAGRPCAGRLELVADPACSLALAEAGRQASQVQVLAAVNPAAHTHRLRYRWRWTSVPGLTR